MSSVEVLAPVRLETRFHAPDQRDDGVNEWQLRVRVYPDEFSIRRVVQPPTPDELDRLTEAVARLTATPPFSEHDAFTSFASAVGATRALWMWRSYVVADAAGGFTVDRSDEEVPTTLHVHGPAGLPESLEVWFVHDNGTRLLAATLSPKLDEIGGDLDLVALRDHVAAYDVLPETWWLSYERARDVGLGVDIDIGAVPPKLDAIVIVGTGDAPASDLVDAHNAASRLAVLAPGTPTNSIEGEPTTDLGDDAETLAALLHVDASAQPGSHSLLTALTGRTPPSALPALGGDLDSYAPGSLAVQGFWPTLWGRALRDVSGTGDREVELARWAIRYLAVEGPRPAMRVGEQPYGLLPASAFDAWVDELGDDLGALEASIREWAIGWRRGAAAAARAAGNRVDGADTSQLLDVLALHAPNRHWEVRPVADLAVIQAARALAGMPPMPATEWDRATARSWRATAYPRSAIGPAAHTGPVPGPPTDELEHAELLRELCAMEPEQLYNEQPEKLGLVGHLFREALVAARAIVGEAIGRSWAGQPMELGAALPLDDEDTYRRYVMQGTDHAVTQIEAIDDTGAELARRFREVREALLVIADLWDDQQARLFRATLAALDTAAFRVDPWLTGIAERRLQRMIDDGAPFRLGAYGWVDAPAPYTAANGGALAPGPTAAGLLHAPSHEQALTAALLRDAAVRYPGDDRWQLDLDSAKVRASVSLAERVRIGVHPYEALGLEVEEIAGDLDTVRVLRKEYPLADDQQERRVCDGAKVLRAARQGALVAGLPADLASRLAPLEHVLDTYADLLVADGIHALVTGRADLANAAMEAAAGLGAPSELRAIRTPRAASTVRVAVWALLAPGRDGAIDADASPVPVADPAYAALVTDELGAGALDSDEPATRDARRRLVTLLGGGEREAAVPTLVGGKYDDLAEGHADADLRHAVMIDLEARLTRLRAHAQTVHDAVPALAGDAQVDACARRWGVDLASVAPSDPTAEKASTADCRAALAAAVRARIAASATPGGGWQSTDDGINALRQAIRDLAGHAELAVLPVVDNDKLPTLYEDDALDETWLELVAAVRPRLAPLEARQLDPTRDRWPSALAGRAGIDDPWDATGPVLVLYGPAATANGAGAVALAALDAWTDSVPSRRHTTAASFGFNSPKSRAPQAVVLAVPPDITQRLTNAGLVDVVLDVRELAHARAARPDDRDGLPYATPAPLVHAQRPVSFFDGWP